MKEKITISFEWWSETDPEIGVPDYQREQLEESAINHIKEMWAEGYTSGELYDTDNEDLVEYQGWWEINTEVVK